MMLGVVPVWDKVFCCFFFVFFWGGGGCLGESGGDGMSLVGES